MRKIRAVGRQIGREFRADRVVLFGSYARGTASDDSDVDLLVIMRFRGKPAEKSAEIRLKLTASMPMDVLVRTPGSLRRRLAMGDMFLREILDHGKVLYEAHHG